MATIAPNQPFFSNGHHPGHQRLSPCSRDLDGSGPLSVAVASQLTASVVVAKQLLEAKAAADRADKKGNLPLHEAGECGRSWV